MSLRKKLLISSVFGSGFLYVYYSCDGGFPRSLMRPRACLTSIMRTYSTWRFVESPDKSYEFGRFGLWSMAELAVGIITGCLPVMPKFFQHVGPKTHSVFSTTRVTPASDSSKTFSSTTLKKSNILFGKHSTGLGTSNAETSPYASQPHGEYCMLDEFGASQHQVDRNSIAVPSGGAATRRDDLEHGHQES